MSLWSHYADRSGSDPEERLQLRVEGTVQGVGFRRWVVREAQRRDLAGWTRNLPDGAVEVAAAGSRDRLAELRASLHRGPPGARVTAVRDIGQPDDTLRRPFRVMHEAPDP